ncbi:hypothetical protein [Streptomyces exfoliatus]|uniref:hypothetical protein n=1 Tax=Streptomyces exfoliatus TaxID=1905 RepID=UPI00378BB04A
MKRRTFRITLDEVFGGETLEASSFHELCGEAARYDHGNCDDLSTCDTSNMIEHGHYFAAVANMGGLDFPATTALYEKYEKSLTHKRCDKDATEWWEFVRPFSVKCHECSAMVYGDPAEETFPQNGCTSCRRPLDVESYIDTFRDQVLDTMLWTTSIYGEEGEHVGDARDHFDTTDIDSEKWDETTEMCRAFVSANWEILGHYTPGDMGHEYAIAAGGWDSAFHGRGLTSAHGDALRHAVKGDHLPELYAYIGDDGEPHLG